MSVNNRYHYPKPYSSIINNKSKFKSREERCKYKITLRRVIEGETEKLGEKTLHDSLSRNRSTRE